MHYVKRHAVAFLALLVALSGTAFAASRTFSSKGTITACVARDGSLHLLAKGKKKCGKKQTKVAWNQKGPAGAAGAAGAPGRDGTAGAKGDQGAPGVDATPVPAEAPRTVAENP